MRVMRAIGHMKSRIVQNFLGYGGAIASITFAVSNLFAATELELPFRVECNGKPIDVEVGHAAPIMGDFDGDKLPDLLVGQFGSGRLRIYRNEGSNTMPNFRTFGWFKAEGSFGEVPAG